MRADAIVVGRGPVCEEKRRRGEREECNELTMLTMMSENTRERTRCAPFSYNEQRVRLTVIGLVLLFLIEVMI